ncbi:hypothetical protein N658DRAFT_417379 [Parathielavia hyrcaniae]|uniref:DUF8004 domain-containing protein n=1 Tax=Parathielavia hyrcaniae TaxID=113614 RepID=A0AAN6Q8F9_9PEZI|nr:hypothetical protein N658DRAFT_417379 [Parathielavia hyrcaniae]
MGLEKPKPRSVLLFSFFPKLTFRTVSPSSSSSEIYQQPALGSSTISYASPASTATTMTGTARTSQDSRSSSRFESSTASSCLSPIEQMSPSLENASLEPTPPRKLHKEPTMPSSPPPPPPPAQESTALPGLSTPPRIPALTATQATPQGRIGAGSRSPSPGQPPSRAKLQSSRPQLRNLSPDPSPRGRSVSVQPPATCSLEPDGWRAVSSPVHGQPNLRLSGESSPPATADKKKRRSWFPGVRSRAGSDVGRPRGPGAWLLTPDSQAEYNTAMLVNGEKIPELWNEAGNVYVYLHPKQSNRGPCFKMADHIFSSSSVLVELLVTDMMAATSHNAGYVDVAPPSGPVTEGHLYLPLGNTDLERLVAARNLFALLMHQPLVATAENPTLFAAVLQVAGLLRRFNFCSFDGSSFGEPVDAAFDFLMDCTGIADVRYSGEKTLEALVLAEQMKSWNLYNEAFAHGVGKYDLIIDLKSPLYDRISISTRRRLDRAHLDLANRQANVNTRLEAFEFPSLFAGIASSTSTEEYKNVKFKEWRNAFAKMRGFVLGYYKGIFGNWPPRARSKKNYFSQSGLNRLCLKILYSDFCALYDLLVDRQSMTPRVIGEGFDDSEHGSKEEKPHEASISALRKVLGEFDKSSPPVLPPIPYDVPKLPSISAVYEKYDDLPAKQQAKYSKALQPHELQLLLIKSRNIDTDALNMPFLLAYKEFELKEAKSTPPSDLPDQRIGHWLFLYVVLQSLPMLVVDAPGLRYTDGVEDFLCEAPQGNPPWTEDAGATRKMWFQTNNSNVVELSADVVMFSVEGIYMRSHCWLAAKEWVAASNPEHPQDLAQGEQQQHQTLTSPIINPPPAAFHDMNPLITTTGPSSPTHLNKSRQRSPSPSDPITTTTSISAATTKNGPSPPQSTHPSPHLHPQQHPQQQQQQYLQHPHPQLRPRASSTNDRARQAFRASIAIGLEPLPMPSMPAAAAERHSHSHSRVMSMASLSSSSAASASGMSGMSSGSPALSGSGSGSAGMGGGDGWGNQLGGLRASRSAVNLQGNNNGGGGEIGDAQQPRKSSVGFGLATSNHGHAASESLGGGSTFDDILKGMDGNGKKARRKLFF